MRETESLCAENIGLKDIARSHRGELISWGGEGLIMYYSTTGSKGLQCKTFLTTDRARGTIFSRLDIFTLLDINVCFLLCLLCSIFLLSKQI